MVYLIDFVDFLRFQMRCWYRFGCFYWLWIFCFSDGLHSGFVDDDPVPGQFPDWGRPRGQNDDPPTAAGDGGTEGRGQGPQREAGNLEDKEIRGQGQTKGV